MIDLGPGIGIQWTTLIQALAMRVGCPFEHLKISAVGTSEKNIMKACKWLVSFAKTMNLPFSFKAISRWRQLTSKPFQTSFPAQDNKCSASIMKKRDGQFHVSSFDRSRRWTWEAYSRLVQRFEFRERRSRRSGVSSDTKGCCRLALPTLCIRRTSPEASLCC
ncbi:DELLA protein RGL1-like protein [Cinnamomum micranthum f. kanehirae]|uniref:DELLA protein RGL1-like protein n=1 Tax=Cinnamomum micranthum f. kanehirae TaxID=337451 RepID=A0A443PU46_9MAGN|nr:DELLA protein RGL1-like protein [Cinnamomum micranthum f. kanehirae]